MVTAWPDGIIGWSEKIQGFVYRKMKEIINNKKVRQGILIAIDLVIVALCIWVSLFMRFRWGHIPYEYYSAAKQSMVLDMAVTVVVFWYFKLYHSVWTYASINELIKVVEAVTVVVFLEISYKAMLFLVLPRSVYFMNYIMLLVLVSMSRLSVRALRFYIHRYSKDEEGIVKTMIVGAGSAGAMLLTELERNHGNNNKVVCIVDDNRNKWGKYLYGIPIKGGRENIISLVLQYGIDEILIAIPSAGKTEVSEVVEVCSRTDARVKILPSITSSLKGNISSNLRDISYKDLLYRDEIDVNDVGIDENIRNKVIMVTGGGGSIGSELCRQIAKRNPKTLIILDIYENNAYAIQMELKNLYKEELDLRVVIASVRDYDRLKLLFEKYRPEMIFHAAAHKHVPLMEISPNEAIKNNVKGTFYAAKLADEFKVEKFILISTDKAVRPTNIMGASKRICEMIIQDWDRKSEHTHYAAVRFGNVLGSNGSVIPLFLEQIEMGGPVTVTHRDITRFFMTIPEAVSLVLQASVYAMGGEIFVLDMGKQVKIYDLAVSLIKMKGFKPNEDINIEITGLRPGEKLYEEVLMDEEGLDVTENRLIHIGKPIQIDYEVFEKGVLDLMDAAENNSPDIKKKTKNVCDTYTITE